MIKIAVTGHRPKRIEGQEEKIREWLKNELNRLIADYGNILLIDGMAQGVDQMAALVALECGAQVSCYFPYRRKIFGAQEYIVDNAAEVRFICDKFQSECYIKRDRRMVDDCDILLVVWDGKPWGGAYTTYQYALEKGRQVIVYPWRGLRRNTSIIDDCLGVGDFLDQI